MRVCVLWCVWCVVFFVCVYMWCVVLVLCVYMWCWVLCVHVVCGVGVVCVHVVLGGACGGACGVVWCVVKLGTRKTPLCVRSKHLRVYGQDVSVCTGNGHACRGL